jgi:hypothetical protein
MKRLWMWSIASACGLTALILIAHLLLPATSPPLDWPTSHTTVLMPAIVEPIAKREEIGEQSVIPISRPIIIEDVGSIVSIRPSPPIEPNPVSEPNRISATEAREAVQQQLQQLQQVQQQQQQQQTTAALALPDQPASARPTIKAESVAPGKAASLPPPEPTTSPSARRMAARGESLQALPKGNIVLHAPNAMRVGERRTVEANVGVNVPIEILRKPLSSRDQTIEGSLRVSSDMVASLNGPGFKIDAVTPEQQAIAEGFPTVWSWNVEAKEDGEQELEATLYVLLPDGDTSSRQRVDSYVQKITVSVRERTWGEWLESFGHEVDAMKAIVVTLVGAATVVFGWFGISFARQKGKVTAKFGHRRKSPA